MAARTPRSIPFHPAEWEAIRAAAERQRLPAATWARAVLGRAARRGEDIILGDDAVLRPLVSS